MRTRKMRLMSFVLALAMMLAIAPVSAFAAVNAGEATTPNNATEITNITFDGNGKRVPLGDDYLVGSTYYYPSNGSNCQWASAQSGGISIRPGYSFKGAGNQVINETMTVAGNIDGGIYGYAVVAVDKDNKIGTISDGVFFSSAKATSEKSTSTYGGKITGGLFHAAISTSYKGEIEGGVFAQDPGTTTGSKHKLKAPGCRIYTQSAYTKYSSIADNTHVYIQNTDKYPEAYVVGEQEIVVTINYPTFDHWEVKVNGTVVNDSTAYKETADTAGNHILTFTMSDADVEVTPVVKPIKFEFGENSTMPEYDGKEYFGDLALDGWHLDTTVNPYILYVKQGTTVDLKNKTIDWRISNYGTVINGITPGNVVNREVTSTTYGDELGKYGRVENIAFKMNVNFGDQNPNITWVTLKNATACEVFPDIVGVIGEQTITIKPTISADLFKGWVVGGDISDELAEQIEKQKDSDTLVLKLDGEKKDRIAIAAKTEGDTFGVKMLDGKATVDGQTVTAAQPGQTVTITMDDSEIPEGMSFDHWVVSPDVELEGGFKATDRTTSFTMPTEELTIYASLRTDSDDGVDAMTVVAGVAIGAGAAVLTYHIGTELYAEQVLGDGVAIPRTREDVALKAWELAGKPAVELNGEPLSEAAQAEKWAVESGLMQNVDGSFNGSKKMSKLKALRVLDKAQKLG